MTCVQPQQCGFEVGPREYLNDFIKIMGRLRGSQDRYLPMLVQKANASLPHLQAVATPLALPSSTAGFVGGTFDLDESQASTSDDSDYVDSPDIVAPSFLMDPTFSAFTETEAFAPPSIIPPFKAAPTSNPFLR